jgi:hypothetical protein
MSSNEVTIASVAGKAPSGRNQRGRRRVVRFVAKFKPQPDNGETIRVE